MTEDRFEQLLADFLADELSEAQLGELKGLAAADPSLARRLRALQATERALARHVIPLDEAERRVAADAQSLRGRQQARFGHPLLRYAAVILLAFVAGYVFRGWSNVDRAAAAPPELAERFVEAQRDFPGSTQFAHALLAIARR